MTKRIGLGVDAGASSTRWLLLDNSGKELGRGKTEPITGHIFTPEDRTTNLGRLEALLEAALKIARPDGFAAGITGFHKGTEVETVFAELITGKLGLEVSRLDLDNDMHVAYASAFDPGEGVLIYAGTGSVGYHETANGEVVRAGGYGYLIDDAGAGYWIGHEAIKQTMRWVDELGHPADYPLAKAVYDLLGSDDWDDILEAIYGCGRSKVASLTAAVAKAANEGDRAAIRILQGAGKELARLAGAIIGRLEGDSLPVAFTGGITQLGPLLTDALQEALPTDTPFHIVTTEPVVAAARLALRRVNFPQ